MNWNIFHWKCELNKNRKLQYFSQTFSKELLFLKYLKSIKIKRQNRSDINVYQIYK